MTVTDRDVSILLERRIRIGHRCFQHLPTLTNPMSQSHTTDIESVGQSLNNFVETVTTALETTQAPTSTIEAVEEEGKELANTVESRLDELEQTTDEQQEELDELDKETSNDIEHTGKRLAELNGRVADVEDVVEGGSGDETPTPESTQTAPQTPLEEICRLPEHVAEDNLSSNQERARFVAKDIEQYGRSVPAGRAITSTDLRKVLSAKEDGSAHTQTVSRVMEFLDRLGKDEVSIKETMSGKKTVVFTDEAVERLAKITNHGVVIGDDRHGVIETDV